MATKKKVLEGREHIDIKVVNPADTKLIIGNLASEDCNTPPRASIGICIPTETGEYMIVYTKDDVEALIKALKKSIKKADELDALLQEEQEEDKEFDSQDFLKTDSQC